MLRSLLLLLLALGSFATSSVLVRSFVPFPEAYGRRDKWEYFLEHADEFDAVFIGSSHVFRGVVPRIVEAEMAAQGIEFHSFNLGSGGVWSVEGDYWLQVVLDHRPEKLKWIFLETGFRQLNRTDNPPQHVRYIHSLGVTRHLVRVAMGLDRPLGQRLSLVLYHAHLCLENLTNVGQGERMLGRRFGREESATVLGPEVIESGLGYESLEDARVFADRRADLLERVDEWEETVAKRKRFEPRTLKRDVPVGMAEGPDALLVAEQVRRTRKAGYRLIYFVPPRIETANGILLLDRAGVFPRLINFGTPMYDPELYEVDLWYDYSHLTREGAALFSRLLADRISQVVRKRKRKR